MPTFDHGDLTIHFSDRGDPHGPPIVLIHGLLWSGRMMGRLAQLLPDHRVLLIDLRGHGTSSKPTDAEMYSWETLASDVISLLDHLGVEGATIGGLSLGANVSLAAANTWPERVAAMVVEMPVLDRAQTFGRTAFGALASVLEATGPVLGPLTRVVGHAPLPRSIPELAAVRDVLSLDPTSGAALLRGLLADHLLFEDLDLEALTMPALVIGHHGDPLHVLEDARQLAEVLPVAELDVRCSIADYRLRPALLAERIAAFLATQPAPR